MPKTDLTGQTFGKWKPHSPMTVRPSNSSGSSLASTFSQHSVGDVLEICGHNSLSPSSSPRMSEWRENLCHQTGGFIRLDIEDEFALANGSQHFLCGLALCQLTPRPWIDSTALHQQAIGQVAVEAYHQGGVVAGEGLKLGHGVSFTDENGGVDNTGGVTEGCGKVGIGEKLGGCLLNT